MPITKYRSVAEMPAPAVAKVENLVARIRESWDRAFVLCPPCWPAGVKRFANHDEANEDRARMTVLRMRSTRNA